MIVPGPPSSWIIRPVAYQSRHKCYATRQWRIKNVQKKTVSMFNKPNDAR